MATTPEGIMALNQPQDAAPQLSYEDSYDAMRQALQQTRPDADMEMQEMLDEVRDDLKELTDEQLTQLIEAVQGLYDSPETYARDVAQLVQEGSLDEEDLPPEYNEEFLATVLVILRDEQRNRMMNSSATAPMEMMLPQQFARGGIAEAARMVASKGRYGDSMLAHITPSEARLLRARGGSGTINPDTGLPEFFLKQIWKAVTNTFKRVVDVAKKIVSSPLGRIVATIGLGMVMGPAIAGFFPSLATATGGLTALGSAVTGAAASGAVTALGGGSFKDVLTSAAVGFLGAPGGPVSNFVGKYTGQFISNPTVNAAVTGTIVGTGAGLVQGQSLGEAVQSGLVQGAIAGGTAYMQSGNTAQASEAAKNAAADAADDAVTKAVAGAPKDATVTNTAMRPSEVRPGEFIKTTTLSNGQVIEQAVTSSGAPLGPPVPAAPTPAEAIGGGFNRMMGNVPNAIDEALAIKAAPTAGAAPGTTAYNEAIKADVISRGMGTAPPSASDIISRSMARTPSVDALKEGIAAKGIPVSTPIGPNAPVVNTYGQPTSPISLSGTAEELSDAFEGLRSVDVTRAQKAAELSGQGMGLYDRARAQAAARGPNVAPTAGTSATPAYQVPEIGASLKKAVTPGTMMEGLGDLFMPGPSSAQYKNMLDDVLAKNPNFTPAQAADYLSKTEMVPGMLRTYGPGVAAGITALGLAGGFKQEEPPASPFAQQMRQPIDLSTNPSAYFVQGLPGVEYGPRGEIIGSKPWSPEGTMQNVMVTGRSYLPPMVNPMMYRAPQYMNQGGSVVQGRGLRDLVAYRPLLERYMADYRNPALDPLTRQAAGFHADKLQQVASRSIVPGRSFLPKRATGIASLAGGGYPRRVGQISGPGTEKSDSIPAMLSDGEFVMTARAVRGMGNGSRREGAKKMYALMHKLEKNASRG